VQQAAIVGQQQQATGLAVEAADRGQHRIAVAEARRQQVVDQAAGVLGRAGVAGRLVQRDRQPHRRVQRLAIDADRLVRHLVVGVQHLAVGVGDAAFAEHPLHLLAAAIAQVGDVLDQLHLPFPSLLQPA
jgi:hypothetical protein